MRLFLAPTSETTGSAMSTETVKPITYPFTEADAKAAHDEWGCNCGPTALSFALQWPLADVRYMIPGFEQKRYTSPTMMRSALDLISQRISCVGRPSVEAMFDQHEYRGRLALVRIQWTGPWTAPGANPRWAYRHTHWITTWTERSVPLIFDCNGGIRGIDSWESEIVPLLTDYERADGGWFPTHIWRLNRR